MRTVNKNRGSPRINTLRTQPMKQDPFGSSERTVAMSAKATSLEVGRMFASGVEQYKYARNRRPGYG